MSGPKFPYLRKIIFPTFELAPPPKPLTPEEKEKQELEDMIREVHEEDQPRYFGSMNSIYQQAVAEIQTEEDRRMFDILDQITAGDITKT